MDWLEPRSLREWAARAFSLPPILLTVAVLALLLTELKFDWLERGVGATLVSTNAERPESGAIWEKGRKTVLFVTHQIDEAVFLSDRVLVFARRPGRLLESVAIDLPRPRALALKRTAEFVRYVDHIWRLIEDAMVSSISFCVGQMSFRKTSLPSPSCPSGSDSKSKSMVPAMP